MHKKNQDKCANTVSGLNSVREKHNELSAESEKEQKNLEESDKKIDKMNAELKAMDKKRECEEKKWKDLELEVNSKKKEITSLKERISNSGSNKENLHVETNDEDENEHNTRQPNTASNSLNGFGIAITPTTMDIVHLKKKLKENFFTKEPQCVSWVGGAQKKSACFLTSRIMKRTFFTSLII